MYYQFNILVAVTRNFETPKKILQFQTPLGVEIAACQQPKADQILGMAGETNFE